MHKNNVPHSEHLDVTAETAAIVTPKLDPLLRRPLRDVSNLSHMPSVSANGVILARVVSVTGNNVLVCLLDFDSVELQARSLCPLPEDWATRQCAVLFENGDPTRPLIVGFLLTAQQSFCSVSVESVRGRFVWLRHHRTGLHLFLLE